MILPLLGGLKYPLRQVRTIYWPAYLGGNWLLPYLEDTATTGGIKIPPPTGIDYHCIWTILPLLGGLKYPLRQVRIIYWPAYLGGNWLLPYLEDTATTGGIKIPPPTDTATTGGIKIPPQTDTATTGGIKIPPQTDTATTGGIKIPPQTGYCHYWGIKIPPQTRYCHCWGN
ncbi:hypothetical protein BDP27DRAFT_1360618 [Rhodocollybia butyracea]|uniref:Uncharacterized protein n=1 Tax=Rhodocollybia butyracea TaxID=206335 RepID=A0A9P5Q2E9_9AGAR|nr:hypothetical protein BDP27DRAFT_1360618 [Rhodocollybia butyracea]